MLRAPSHTKPHILLSPRRQEILAIIKDHPYLTMDMVWRRFPGIPHRTLANDVAQLVKQHFVRQHGVTRGTSYTAAISEQHR